MKCTDLQPIKKREKELLSSPLTDQQLHLEPIKNNESSFYLPLELLCASLKGSGDCIPHQGLVCSLIWYQHRSLLFASTSSSFHIAESKEYPQIQLIYIAIKQMNNLK